MNFILINTEYIFIFSIHFDYFKALFGGIGKFMELKSRESVAINDVDASVTYSDGPKNRFKVLRFYISANSDEKTICCQNVAPLQKAPHLKDDTSHMCLWSTS